MYVYVQMRLKVNFKCLPQSLFFIFLSIFNVYKYFACMCTICIPGALEVRREHLIL